MKKIKPIIFVLVFLISLFVMGRTIAYFTSETEFNNEFITSKFEFEAEEEFVSPTNWLPGDETPKTLTVKNTGNVDVKARVCIEEEWTSHNGDTLPNTYNNESVAIINLDNEADWTKNGNCYTYKGVLHPNDETNSFIKSVKYNPNIGSDVTCTQTGNTYTCSSSGAGYDNATYVLTLKVQTVQANMVNELWPNSPRYSVGSGTMGLPLLSENTYDDTTSMTNGLYFKHTIGDASLWCIKENNSDTCVDYSIFSDVYFETEEDCINNLLNQEGNSNYNCSETHVDNAILNTSFEFDITNDMVEDYSLLNAGHYSLPMSKCEDDSINDVCTNKNYEQNKEIILNAFGGDCHNAGIAKKYNKYKILSFFGIPTVYADDLYPDGIICNCGSTLINLFPNGDLHYKTINGNCLFNGYSGSFSCVMNDS